MAVRTKDEIMELIRTRIGEDSSDDAIALIEDVNDTFDELASSASDNTNWKQKYEENDRDWRQKYRDRFFNKADNDDKDDKEEFDSEKKPVFFDELFKED